MTILLLILKIIGIILLVLLGILLVVLLLLLLVPLRYGLEGRFREGLKARVDGSWLLKLVHVRGEAINSQIRLRFLGLGHCFKKWYFGPWEQEETESEIAEQGAAGETPPGEAASVPAAEHKAPKKEEPAGEEPKEKSKKKASRAAEKAREKYESLFEELQQAQEARKKAAEADDNPASEAQEEEKKNLLRRANDLTEKIIDFWDDEDNQEAVYLIQKKLRDVGQHLLPTDFLLQGELGLKDPSATGQIVGWVYRLYPLYGDHIRLDGLYEEERIDIYLRLGGRIRLGTLVAAAGRLYMNRRIRRWIRELRHKKKEKAGGAKAPDGEGESNGREK